MEWFCKISLLPSGALSPEKKTRPRPGFSTIPHFDASVGASSLEFDWLPMTSELKTEVLWWWENRTFKHEAHVFLCEDKTAFTREYLGKPFLCRQHFILKLCERAGVKPFGFHAIRHFIASILFRLGKPVGVIQSILRHKNASTTECYLRSLGFEETRSALEELPGRGPGRVAQMKTARGL